MRPDRTLLLEALLNFSATPEDIARRLGALPFDSDRGLVTLSTLHIGKVLNLYLDKQLTASQVEDWANLIEGRDDIQCEQANEGLLSEVIFELANPELTMSLTSDR